jgi:two-component system response regulator HydG
VRELENACEMLVALADGSLDPSLLEEGRAPRSERGTLRERVEAFERGLLAEALQAAGGNKAAAARALGISRVTLYEKLAKHGLSS